MRNEMNDYMIFWGVNVPDYNFFHYICSVHFEKSKTKADNNRKVPGIWSQKKDR